MSTEIKNTLFRFVSLRSPELSDKKNIVKRFVYCPNITTPFHSAVTNKGTKTKWQALQTTNPTVKLDEAAVKALHLNLYELGVWIAKNKNSFSLKDLLAEFAKVKAPLLTNDQIKSLWENLFYQVVQQTDFYAKEAIIQMLVAQHVYNNSNYITTEIAARKIQVDAPLSVLDQEFAQILVNAKVVLPRELFVDDEAASSSNRIVAPKAKATSPSKPMEMFQKRYTAQRNVEQLKQLKKELVKAEKQYQKEYAQAYTQAQADYKLQIQPILDDYQAQAQRTIGTDPAAPMSQPQLPKFDFQFRQPVAITHLQNQLSSDSLTTLFTLMELPKTSDAKARLSYDSDLEDVSYSDVYNRINQITNDNVDIITDNTPNDATTYVNNNGILIPVNTFSGNPFDYIICPYQTATGTEFHIGIIVPDASYTVNTSGSYYNLLGQQSGVNGITFMERTGNLILLRLQKTYTESLNNGAEIQATIAFTNDTVASFNITPEGTALFKSCFRGKCQLNNSGNTADPTGGVVLENHFIPRGFGIKQLGIADYKKVDQSIHGYVEGEVAHIENVMAREFKEKSTRRTTRTDTSITTSNESEREQLTDTTTANRFEMQSEVSKVLQESRDFNADVRFHAQFSNSYSLDSNVGMANHSSKEESNRQALTQAQDVTQRAMDRLVTKVKQERVEKIMDEFEEKNSHGFDNRKGDKHVVGVYRWVDKIFKNQIFNYGKRLMFEFMIPEPARLHYLATQPLLSSANTLTEPIDPRKSNIHTLTDFSKIDVVTAKYWGSVFNVELKPMPESEISVGKSLQGSSAGEISKIEYFGVKDDLTIPEGYSAISGKILISGTHNGSDNSQWMRGTIGDKSVKADYMGDTHTSTEMFFDTPFVGTIPIACDYSNFFSGVSTFITKCKLNVYAFNQWQQDTFKAIINAYQAELKAYNEALQAAKETQKSIKESNPMYYRQIENITLRKNCISYILDQNPLVKNTYGRDLSNGKSSFTEYELGVSQDLDKYASLVKFMEQAFEWDLISYHFYPYYWGNRKNWADMYGFECNDALFRSFMQSGMARVVVTVRPGFEDAVRYYMQTGQLWQGGEVPVVDDALYLSIIDELREVKGKSEGKAWWTRVPTSLTLLQAQTIGLNVTKALPYNDNDLMDFEDPNGVPKSMDIGIDMSQLGNSVGNARLVGTILGTEGVESKVVLKRIDGTIQDLTYTDANGNWELNHLPNAKYELLLDAQNDLSDYVVTMGSKQLTVTLEDNQTLEVALEVKKM